MCKSIRSNSSAAKARLCIGLVSAAVFSTLVWVGCGGDSGSPTSSKTTKCTLKIEMDPKDGDNRVLRDPDQETYKAGDTVTLTVIEGSGYKFIGWSGGGLTDDTDTAYTVKIKMDGNKSLTAHFQPVYTLKISIEPEKGGTVSSSDSGKTKYEDGDKVTLTATAKPGYTFTGWSGASTSEANTVTITINGNKTLTANFQLVPVPDSCSANPYLAGCPGYCTANPAAPGCVTDPCVANFTPECPGYCQFYPNTPGCQSDPCVINPTPECPGYCAANPTASECQSDPCVTDPTPSCPGYCAANPTAPECVTDPCVANFTPECPGYCALYPNTPGCEIDDPCTTVDSLTTPGCSGYCPSTQTGCPGYVDPDIDSCAANPYLVGCPAYIVCLANPTPECPDYVDPCTTADSLTTPGCSGYVPPRKWCYFEPTSYNDYVGECTEIGSTGKYNTELGCEGYKGEVMTEENCDDRSTGCAEGPTEECCALNSSYEGCSSTDREYCSWGGGATCIEIAGNTDCSDGVKVSSCPTIDPADKGYCKYTSGCHPATKQHCAGSGEFFQGDNPTCTGIGETGPKDGACLNSQNQQLFCQWDSGCYEMNSKEDPDKRACSVIQSACEQGGEVYIGVTGLNASNNYGEGVQCSATGTKVDGGTPPDGGGYCYYGFDKCYDVPASGVCGVDASTSTSASCAGAAGTYCDYGQPTQYGNGGCFFKPGVSKSIGSICGTVGDKDLEHATAVTEADCIASNTTNSCIQVANDPGATGDNAPGCNPLKP